MAVEIYNSVAEGLKLKVKKNLELNYTFGKVTGGKLVEGLFAPAHSEKG